MISVIHNPRCSKSRKALSILEEKNLAFEVREYLKTPLDEVEIESILVKLGVEVDEIIRSNESEYKELKISELNRSGVIKALVKYPKLIQRPIVINGDQAVIARPPELVEEIL